MAKGKPGPGGSDNTPRPYAEVAAEYETWLRRQPLAESTRRAYLRGARDFLEWLEGSDLEYGDPLSDPHARNFAARDWRAHLKRSRRLAPRSVNAALAAADSLFRFRGLGPADAPREELPREAPHGLDPDEQKRFLRTVERLSPARDRAICALLFYTALRVSECAALDLDDVAISARKGRMQVREGKGDRYREIPLNAAARSRLDEWLAERPQLARDTERALFVNRRGVRLSARSIGALVNRVGREGWIEGLTPHRLRHTALTLLVRSGADLVLVAEIAGHQRLETTRRYTLPSEQDRAAAMSALEVEH